MTGDATFSRDRRYRYRLWRRWDHTRPVVVFVLLNPSTADARHDDPTIRRCLGFARRWGYGGIEVVNVFAYRATNPRVLRTLRDPVGRANRYHVRVALAHAALVVLAWGASTEGDRMIKVSHAHCLGLTSAGQPRHPLYLRRDVRPVPYPALPAGAA